MATITPHLWFDKEAKEAAEFYTSLLPNSRVTSTITLHDTPSGDCDLVSFDLANQPFMAISAGPLFTFNPSVSFILNFDPSQDRDARVHLDRLWEKLSEGGTALMPLDPTRSANAMAGYRTDMGFPGSSCSQIPWAKSGPSSFHR